jgi:hypothetical protein
MSSWKSGSATVSVSKFPSCQQSGGTACRHWYASNQRADRSSSILLQRTTYGRWNSEAQSRTVVKVSCIEGACMLSDNWNKQCRMHRWTARSLLQPDCWDFARRLLLVFGRRGSIDWLVLLGFNLPSDRAYLHESLGFDERSNRGMHRFESSTSLHVHHYLNCDRQPGHNSRKSAQWLQNMITRMREAAPVRFTVTANVRQL